MTSICNYLLYCTWCVCVCVRASVCVSVCVFTLYVYCMNTYSSPTKPHHGQCVNQLNVCVWSIIKTQQRSSHVTAAPWATPSTSACDECRSEEVGQKNALMSLGVERVRRHICGCKDYPTHTHKHNVCTYTLAQT